MQPPFSGRLAGKVAVVTGVARGVSATIATRLLNEGATVHIADIADADGIECVKQLAATGASAHYHHLDATGEAQWLSTLGSIAAAQGRAGRRPCHHEQTDFARPWRAWRTRRKWSPPFCFLLPAKRLLLPVQNWPSMAVRWRNDHYRMFA